MDVNLTKPNSKNKASKANTTSTSKNHYKVTTCYAVYGNIYIKKKKGLKDIKVKAAAIYEFNNNLIPIELKSPSD